MSYSTDPELNDIYIISNYIGSSTYSFYKVYKITNKLAFLRLLRDDDITINVDEGASGTYKKFAIDEYYMDCMGNYRDKRIKKEDLHRYKKNNEFEYTLYFN